jgi:hypothetical protein
VACENGGNVGRYEVSVTQQPKLATIGMLQMQTRAAFHFGEEARNAGGSA